MAEEQVQEISIEDLQLSLEVYEIQAEEKLKKLQALFAEKKTVDLAKMFYEERSSLEIKFQNIVSDLTQFLINQQIASTDKLRKTFYKILQNPLNVLFKVSRFEIFNLRLNAFDIQLQPIDAVAELGASILANIEKHDQIAAAKMTSRYAGGQYQSFEQFLEDAQSKLIQDLIFLFYSYLRKGGGIIRKKFQDKVRVVELYSKIQQKLLKRSIEVGDVRTLKQLSTLNYQIYLLQNSYDVLCFYLKVPLKAVFAEIFKQLQTLGLKAKQNSNYDLFILIFLRYSKQIIAKLDQQGIDEMFSSYIENALVSLLQLWGCRLCYYQQFFDLFCKLLSLHPRKASALLTCLKFNPQLKKDDIVLLRTNFKHDLQQKHSQLLSLLRNKTMEQINTSLSEYYHRLLYNLDFDAYSRDQLLELLTLLNGNSSLGQFFGITERAFKQWNHTIDFVNPHKYIEGEFKYPNLQSAKLFQSLRLLNNLCVLQKKGVKDYQQLVKAGSIQKGLIGLSSFLFSNEKAKALLSSEELVKILLTSVLQFLRRAILTPSDWQFTCNLFSSNIKHLSSPYNTKMIAVIREIISSNVVSFGVKSSTNIFSNIVEVEKQLKLDSNLTLQCINSTFMSGVIKNNEEIKKFRFFDSKISDFKTITKTQKAFLEKYGCLNGEIIEAKDPACFILSELQIITNPVQFDKVMDNYYFTLDNNSKRFVQYLCTSWTESAPQRIPSILTIVQNLINSYPIVIPVFCTTRVTVNNVAKRFIEAIVNKITPESYSLLKSIVQCRSIRYKNGRDYVKEQIIPLLLKQTLKLINEGSQKLEHYQLLSLVIANSRPADIKIDLIQASIDIIKYEISQSKTSEQAYRLSQGNLIILKKFFEKKEVDMRKKGLLSLFQEQIWSEIRTKSILLTAQNIKKQLQRNKIPDQIMISPYTLAQEYQTQTVKLEKSQPKPKVEQDSNIQILSLKNSLANKTANANLLLERKQQTGTVVDLSRLKYNIESHLGDEIKEFCRKQGFKIVTAYKEESSNSQANDQNVTLVQYYLKQFQNPEISAELVVKYLLSLLSGEVNYCFLFSNYSNLQKLFTFLILLLGHAIKGKKIQTANPTLIEQLLILSLVDKQKTIKTIINVFSDIGYTNLWSESYNSLKNIDYLKEIRAKSQFKQQEEDQTFFSWMLRVSLEKQNVKAELNQLLGKIFESRPKQQNSLMYKVTLNRVLLNLIMKSLQIPNLSYVSLLFHSNYNNLRLYTDQLHEGLKALNMASKNRAYNQYIQLSKDIEDEEFFNPMKLFKYNFQFFIRIEKQGYKFKKSEEEKLGRERVLKVLRSGVTGEELNKQIEKVIEDYEVQLQKLQYNIASRVKAFYLATKLRDLSYQNSLTVCLLFENLSDLQFTTEDILAKIKQIQLFSLIMSIYNTLVRFGKSNECENFLFSDEKEVNISSIRRYSFSMSRVYQKCQLEFDEVLQRCIQGLKYFLATKVGRQWVSSIDIYPPFLNKNFISFKQSEQLAAKIRTNITKTIQPFQAIQLPGDLNSLSGVVKGLKQLKKGHILSKDKIKIKISGKSYSLSQFLVPLRDHLINSQTLSKTKEGYLYFNKYKKSQKTLEEIQILGFIVGYCIVNNIEIDLPLHSSLLSAVGFGVCDLQDLLDINFKVWQDLRNLMSIGESKDLNLNFSYLFQSLETLQSERVQLLDKGTSKKVNNLNREQYCDLVCCYLLYKIVSKQVTRFLEGIVYLCPKELLSSLKITEIHRFFIKKFPNYSQAILKQHMRKRGIVLPDSVLLKGKRVENLKDYQTIQWLCEVVEQTAALRDKIWRNESNIILCTSMGQDIDYDADWGRLVIGRIGSKQELKQALLRLK